MEKLLKKQVAILTCCCADPALLHWPSAVANGCKEHLCCGFGCGAGASISAGSWVPLRPSAAPIKHRLSFSGAGLCQGHAKGKWEMEQGRVMGGEGAETEHSH